MIQAGDTAFVLVSAALVLFMTRAWPCSTCAARTSLGTIMQSFFMIALISMEWVALGYSMSFLG